MKMAGTYVTSTVSNETVRAFVPFPLPPDPPVRLEAEDYDLIETSNRALGRLDGVTALLPDPTLFIYFYVRKEALLSSQIEGTQSSFSDLLLHEERLAPGVPRDDVQDVSNYVSAMNHGLRRIREDKFPLCLRLLREIHAALLSKGRGSGKNPGEFRRSQNWIGGTRPGNARFLPPPPDRVMECLSRLEKFIHDRPFRTPALIKAAWSHVQFETVRPFLDGNGRIGRLLITLLLCAENVLQEPLLYLSLYFKQHRQEYYERLQAVRLESDWLGWLRFFLHGVRETAQQAAVTSKRILSQIDEDRARIDKLGQKAGSASRVFHLLQRHPLVTVPSSSDRLGVSAPTARSAIEGLEKLGILREITGKRRDRIYLYDRYVKILEEGTDPM